MRNRTYGIDPDVLSYINKISTNFGIFLLPKYVKDINTFVKGVKNLGLWNNMICWPLRSYQNIGTGTVVYSFGGLKEVNGTMINSPSWSNDGIIFNDSLNQRISLNDQILSEGSDYTIFGVQRFYVPSAIQNKSSISLGNSRGGLVGAEGLSGIRLRYANWDYELSSPGAVLSNVSDTSLNFIGALIGWNGGSLMIGGRSIFNTKNTGNWTISPATTFSTIGAHHISGATYNSPWNGSIAFSMILNSAISFDLYITLYELYKKTLGKGLLLV